MKKRIYTYLYKKPTKKEKSKADWVAEGARTNSLLEIRKQNEDSKDIKQKTPSMDIRCS